MRIKILESLDKGICIISPYTRLLIRLTAVDQNGRNFIADVGVGDLRYFPPGIPHSIQGLAEGCEFLLVFDDGSFSDYTFTLSDWFAHTPKDVLAANFGVPENAFAHIPRQ